MSSGRTTFPASSGAFLKEECVCSGCNKTIAMDETRKAGLCSECGQKASFHVRCYSIHLENPLASVGSVQLSKMNDIFCPVEGCGGQCAMMTEKVWDAVKVAVIASSASDSPKKNTSTKEHKAPSPKHVKSPKKVYKDPAVLDVFAMSGGDAWSGVEAAPSSGGQTSASYEEDFC